MNKPKLRVKVNDQTNTLTLINPNHKWHYQTVHFSDVKKADSFVSLLQANKKRYDQIGGICKKNSNQWLDLLKLA
jgi:hypothetical protein